ncbi:MAG: hypothetical protein EHM35_12705 [Planctomycetaceae bacterium]|nr:MAG: hypothetical protein EHM35_12705 [Planctomycetaceae bacterium]
MPKYYKDLVPYLMTYLSGSTAACGTSSTEIDVTAKATIFDIHAEGAAVYYEVNGTAATTTSPGYVPQDGHWSVGPLDNLSTLFVIGAGTAAVAHVEFNQI